MYNTLYILQYSCTCTVIAKDERYMYMTALGVLCCFALLFVSLLLPSFLIISH